MSLRAAFSSVPRSLTLCCQSDAAGAEHTNHDENDFACGSLQGRSLRHERQLPVFGLVADDGNMGPFVFHEH